MTMMATDGVLRESEEGSEALPAVGRWDSA